MLAFSLKPPVRLPREDGLAGGWAVSRGLVPYPEAVAAMEARAAAIAEGSAGELVWLLEHPPLYTAGVSAKRADLLDADRLPVFETGRGGQFTYHGPGQRVAYVMLDVGKRGRDVRAFVAGLETWLVQALEELGVEAGPREGRIGVWVARGIGEAKIAAIGVKLRRWVSFHGISLNVSPNLADFDGIVPCGVTEHGVTSLADLGVTADMTATDAALRRAFGSVFGPVEDQAAPV
jgi:lipoyl(octanoyl) transferase